MSIIIKGEWRMPKKCRECLLCEPYKTYNDGTENEFCIPTGKPLAEGETPQDPKGEGRSCPLVELPEKHGDLIDRDALVKDLTNGIKAGFLFEGYEEYPNINSAEDCVECVKYADAVIEAEGD